MRWVLWFVLTGQVVLLSRDINQLNVLLTQPKARGAFGELTLSRMLSDLFGSHTEMFELQYQMEWGERADAAIFVRPDRSQFVCVDAKFPMANAQPLLEGEVDEAVRKDYEKAFARDVLLQAESIRSKSTDAWGELGSSSMKRFQWARA